MTEFYCRHHDLPLTVAQYLFYRWPRICLVCRSDSLVLVLFPLSWFITRFWTREAWRVPVLKLKLIALPEHLRSPPVFSDLRVAQASVCFVVVCPHFLCAFFVFFCFDLCIVCSTMICFWSALLYHQTFHKPKQQQHQQQKGLRRKVLRKG